MPSPSADAPSAYPATGDPAPADWRDYPPLRLPRILEVALTQMVEHGYDATTVRTIAREVGVTVPALYYHHANKQAILAALLDHAMDMVTRHLDAALTAAGDDPVRRLTAAVEAIALYMAHHRELAFLDSERRALTPENLQHYVRRRDHVDRALGAAIEDGCTAGVCSARRCPMRPAGRSCRCARASPAGTGPTDRRLPPRRRRTTSASPWRPSSTERSRSRRPSITPPARLSARSPDPTRPCGRRHQCGPRPTSCRTPVDGDREPRYRRTQRGRSRAMSSTADCTCSGELTFTAM